MRFSFIEYKNTIIVSIITLFVLSSIFFFSYKFTSPSHVEFSSKEVDERNYENLSSAVVNSIPEIVVTHVKTPSSLKAVYMSSWAAGSQKFRDHLFDLIDNTEANAVVIDIKDYTGRISFMVQDPNLIKIGSAQDRIPDIKEFIAKLHEKNVYVIGRISSFQDSFLINVYPESAVKNKEGQIWKDYKGVKWLDAGSKPVWEY
jgi:hypothetical protein